MAAMPLAHAEPAQKKRSTPSSTSRWWSRSIAGITLGHYSGIRGEPEAARRRLHQAGEDDHRSGDLLTVVTGIAGMTDLAKGRPRGRQGDDLLSHLLDAGLDHRPRRRQRRSSRSWA